MNEYCPTCFYPLDAIEGDDGRLCSVCQWFGDKTEAIKTSPFPSELEGHFIKLISLYREICRAELSGELLAENADSEHQRLLQLVKERAKHCHHTLLFFFRKFIMDPLK